MAIEFCLSEWDKDEPNLDQLGESNSDYVIALLADSVLRPQL